MKPRRRFALVIGWIFIFCLLGCSDDTSGPSVEFGLDAGQDGIANSDVAPTDMAEVFDGADLPRTDGPIPDQARTERRVTDARPKDTRPPDQRPRLDGLPPEPSNSKCANPKVITLVNQSAVEHGTTTGAPNEFAMVLCSGELVDYMRGPQVYYKVTLEGGKKYMARLTEDFDATLYAFPASTVCSTTAIDKACKNPPGDIYNIYNSDEVLASGGELIRLAPATTSDWIIVVDSFDQDAHGEFTLTISPVDPPAHQNCASAKPLTLVSGNVVEQGDTSVAFNEFPKSISCGVYQTYFWDGPQLYYRVSLAANTAYKFMLKPTFTSHFYIFSAKANCAPSAINPSCGSFGQTGDIYESAPSNQTTAITFWPESAGDYIVAVDSPKRTWSGPFELTIQEVAVPGHCRCANAKALTLSSSPVVENGDQSNLPNEFGANILCGKTKAAKASQLYYRVSLQAGKTYTITAEPVLYEDVVLYAFTDTTCSMSSINAQCANWYADAGGKSAIETLTIQATSNMDVIIAVDAQIADETGKFILTIRW